MKMFVKMLVPPREVYTKIIFQEFQDEREEAIDLSIQNYFVEGECFLYTISLDIHSKNRCVKWEIDGTLSCNCMMFERKGVLCSHMIKVLRDVMDIKEFLPSQYILKKWTKQARAKAIQDMHGCEIQADSKLQQTWRYRVLCSTFTKISSRASVSEKNTQVSE